MAKTRFIAVVDGRSVPVYKDGDQVSFSRPTLKEAVEALNQRFIEMKKNGDNVVRMSISEFIHYKG